MPTFGRDRIRRFAHDVAGKKKLAARDFEAYLMVNLSTRTTANSSAHIHVF